MKEGGSSQEGKQATLHLSKSLILFLLLSIGCSDPTGGRDCTLIGCASGLYLNFEQAAEPGTIVTLQLAGTPWRVVCGVDADCSKGLFFEGLRVSHVVVQVSVGTESVEFERRPEYVETMPNGPGCEPTCFIAEITVGVPQS